MIRRITMRKLMMIFYSLLMCLPFISVGFRCAYVSLNKNAYESYYGETINDHKNMYINDYTDFKVNTVYWFNTINTVSDISNTYGGNTIRLYVNNVKIQNTLNSNIAMITFYHDANREYFDIHFRDTNGTVILNYFTNQPIINEISFEYVSYNADTTILNTFLQDMYIHNVVYNNYSYLDNAFDYSLSVFIKDNNTGLIDFVGLFSNMFLGNSNVENALYLGFLNFYLNYALMVSCVYFLFEVLMWFINYCRKWLYAFEEKGGAE